MAKQIVEVNTHPPYLAFVSATKGSTTVKSYLYPAYVARFASLMDAVEQAHKEATHRADQLEPVVKRERREPREPLLYGREEVFDKASRGRR
jgi:hypothetical protein